MQGFEDYLVEGLNAEGIEEVPARKASRVLEYYRRHVDKHNNFPPTQRLPLIWKVC
jgi:hypothetical protein